MDHSPQQIQLSKLRKIIADRMTSSPQAAAQYTLHMEVDATNLVACKHTAALKADGKLTYTHILIKLIAHVLDCHPQLNANLIDDVIHLHQSKNIGVAIALDDGLIVPVIKAGSEPDC